MNVPATVENIVRAALSPTNRTAVVVIQTKEAKRTKKDAQAMGVKELVSSYTTEFGGVANRIHNVQLVSHLIDDTLIAPGATFSFNGTTGERNASKGFLDAPVIINGELTTGLGGGVCQVSTTVFNAAYEAGLSITARTNHALYISHYPQGRDATVNYPDVDLKFVNDTKAWLLLRTFVSSYSLTVNLYGTSPHRRVESTTAPLVVDGHTPTEWVKDSDAREGDEDHRRVRLAAARDLGAPEGLRGGREAALRHGLVVALRRREADHPHRNEEARAAAQADRAERADRRDRADGALRGLRDRPGRRARPARRRARRSRPRPRPLRCRGAASPAASSGAAWRGRPSRAASSRRRPSRRRRR